VSATQKPKAKDEEDESNVQRRELGARRRPHPRDVPLAGAGFGHDRGDKGRYRCFAFVTEIAAVVVLENRDYVSHQAVDAPGVDRAKALDANEPLRVKFDKLGELVYVCAFYAPMNSEVIVSP
jgi:hypothetical protein